MAESSAAAKPNDADLVGSLDPASRAALAKMFNTIHPDLPEVVDIPEEFTLKVKLSDESVLGFERRTVGPWAKKAIFLGDPQVFDFHLVDEGGWKILVVTRKPKAKGAKK